LRGAAGMTHEPAAQHHGREIGLERECMPERLGNDHGLDRSAGRSAVLLREWQAKNAELGILPPHAAVEAVRLLQVVLALLEIVAIGKEPLDAFLEQPLLLGQLEVHWLQPPPIRTRIIARSPKGDEAIQERQLRLL